MLDFYSPTDNWSNGLKIEDKNKAKETEKYLSGEWLNSKDNSEKECLIVYYKLRPGFIPIGQNIKELPLMD